MSNKHDDLCEKAKGAITAVFSDKSVDRLTARESLKSLRDEINILLDTL
jgi:hypothetical protein